MRTRIAMLFVVAVMFLVVPMVAEAQCPTVKDETCDYIPGVDGPEYEGPEEPGCIFVNFGEFQVIICDGDADFDQEIFDRFGEEPDDETFIEFFMEFFVDIIWNS